MCPLDAAYLSVKTLPVTDLHHLTTPIWQQSKRNGLCTYLTHPISLNGIPRVHTTHDNMRKIQRLLHHMAAPRLACHLHIMRCLQAEGAHVLAQGA